MLSQTYWTSNDYISMTDNMSAEEEFAADTAYVALQ